MAAHGPATTPSAGRPTSHQRVMLPLTSAGERPALVRTIRTTSVSRIDVPASRSGAWCPAPWPGVARRL
jgi:hypothetical protein